MNSVKGSDSGSDPTRPRTEWLCGRCENLVFRRHRHLCPRCGAPREAGAEARLRRKAQRVERAVWGVGWGALVCWEERDGMDGGGVASGMDISMIS